MFYDLKSLRKITLEEYNFIEYTDEMFESTKINELSIKGSLEI